MEDWDYKYKAEIVSYHHGKIFISCDEFRSIKANGVGIALIESNKLPKKAFPVSLFCVYGMYTCKYDDHDELCMESTESFVDSEVQCKILYDVSCSPYLNLRINGAMYINESKQSGKVFTLCVIGRSDFNNKDYLRVYKDLIEATPDDKIGIDNSIWRLKGVISTFIS